MTTNKYVMFTESFIWHYQSCQSSRICCFSTCIEHGVAAATLDTGLLVSPKNAHGVELAVYG